MAEDIDRQAGRQRALRTIGAEIAGRLAHLARDAERVGLEPARASAFREAADTLTKAFGTTPFVPKAPRPAQE